MKVKVKQPEKVSQVIQSKTKAANQAPIERILQRYSSLGESGKVRGESVVQREVIPNEDELLQGKFESVERGKGKGESAVQREIIPDEDGLLESGENGKVKGESAVQREIIPDEDELLESGENGKVKGESAVQREIIPDEDGLLKLGENGKVRGEREFFSPFTSHISPKESISPFTSPLSPFTSPLSPNKTGLPDKLKSGIENLSGYSMDDVRVHYNSPKPAQLQALAYTQGTNIHVAPGQEKHLPHEAWHVVQQMQGRVQPTMQLQGVNVNDNEGLEREADVMGEKVVLQKVKISRSNISFHNNNSAVTQFFTINPEETDKTYQSIRQDLITQLHGDYFDLINKEENINKLLPILFPGAEERTEKQKQYIESSDYENIDGYNTYLTKTLERIKTGAEQLYESIGYWRNQISKNQVSFINNLSKHEASVDKIVLTGSDLHDKGLGAVFVTYKYGYFFWKYTKEVVIKPENREIEESLLSSRQDSLANKFNEYQWEINGDLVEDGKIQTINMLSTKEYGTIVEKISGNQIKDSLGAPEKTEITDNLDLLSIIKSIVFACIAGISDLHYENILWRDGMPYLIDADNALVSSLIFNEKSTQQQKGFPKDLGSIKIISITPNILKDIRQAFKNKHGRVVPINTTTQQGYRNAYFRVTDKNKQLFFSGYKDNLLKGLKRQTDGGNSLINEEAWEKEKAEISKDFMSGQIPFYKYWYSEGIVKHNFKDIYQGKTLDNLINKMKEKAI
ncbi:MAG: class I adenylate cyclase [Bacteroidales bacterium]|jgi:hypothetical protein|nr:class I adenylate cyclase [Bacteroidales bacterium]